MTKHSANAYRGIAQLVEQRSPKPRAVSSKLTTPAITAQVLRSLCALFLYACSKVEPFRMASAFALAIFSGNIIFMFVFRNTFSREGAGEENSMLFAFLQFFEIHA